MKVSHSVTSASGQPSSNALIADPQQRLIASLDAVPSRAMLARLHLTYLWRHRRRLNIEAPRSFNELVQRRKLIDRDPRMPGLIDKLMVKQFVTDTLGREWVTPTIWSGDALPDVPPMPAPFVVKSRHGCKQARFVRTGTENWDEIRRASRKWMQSGYGQWLDEWGYRDVPRGLLIEPFIGAGPALPVDYKLHVFHGRAEGIQVHLDREKRHRWLLFDRSWRQISTHRSDSVTAPASLQLMIEGAEALGSLFDYVRVDFYDAGSTPRFGEMTFYPGSGLDPFDPPELDLRMGRYWLAQLGTHSSPLLSLPSQPPIRKAAIALAKVLSKRKTKI